MTWLNLIVLLALISGGSSGPGEAECECCGIDFDNCPDKEEPKDKWVICYYPNWARPRQGVAHFTAQDIDSSLCTHINYAVTVLDDNTLTITEYLDSYTVDDEHKNYNEISAYKDKGLTVMMSIGGCRDSVEGDKWSRMISSDSTRKEFIQSVLVFLNKYKFDGLDVYYSANQPADKDKFTKLIRDLKAAFKEKFLLSVHVSSNIQKIEQSYDMTSVCQVADWINVASYDDQFTPVSEGTTVGQAPICKESGGTGLVCSFEAKEGWTKGYDKINGNFIYKGNQFASTPSVGELSRKSCLINYLDLRGVNLWMVDYDDFKNVYGCGTYPLLKTLNKHLRGLKTDVQCF